MLYQSNPIMNYIATEAGLHPKDPKMIFRGEIMFEVMSKETGAIWGGSIPADEPARQEKIDKINVVWP
jgi:hypothetical protein